MPDLRIRPRPDARGSRGLRTPSVPPDLEVPHRQRDRVPADRRLRNVSSRGSWGNVWALDASTGKRVWHRRYKNHCLAASRPSAAGSSISRSFRSPAGDRSGDGMVVALDAYSGKEISALRGPAQRVDSARRRRDRLLRRLGSPPLRAVGEGKPARWTFEADEELNGAPAYANDTVYVGSDGGRLFAVAARSGRLRWQAEALRREYFYATPGPCLRTRSSGTRTAPCTPSARRRATSSGPSGPARTSTRPRPSGTRPSTSARTTATSTPSTPLPATSAGGTTRPSHPRGTDRHGGARVLLELRNVPDANGTRYAEPGPQQTFALDARSGKLVFPAGKYSPIVADEERAYLVGAGSVYALDGAAAASPGAA